jgi:hypothetical protein
MHKSVHLRSAKRDPLYQSRKTRLAKALFSGFQILRLVKIFAGDDFADLLINIP